jgi:glutaredoxin
LITKQGCRSCTRVINLLRAKGIMPSVIDVLADQEIGKLHIEAAYGATSVPVLEYNDGSWHGVVGYTAIAEHIKLIEREA